MAEAEGNSTARHVKSGHLFKRGKGPFPSWKRRFLVLNTAGLLSLYHDSDCQGKVYVVGDLSKDKLSILRGAEACSKCTFPKFVPVACCIAFLSPRTVYLHSTSSQDAIEWCETLQHFTTIVQGQTNINKPSSPGHSAHAVSPSRSVFSESDAQMPASSGVTPDGKSATKQSKVSRFRSFTVRRRPSFLSGFSRRRQSPKAAEAPGALSSREASKAGREPATEALSFREASMAATEPVREALSSRVLPEAAQKPSTEALNSTKEPATETLSSREASNAPKESVTEVLSPRELLEAVKDPLTGELNSPKEPATEVLSSREAPAATKEPATDPGRADSEGTLLERHNEQSASTTKKTAVTCQQNAEQVSPEKKGDVERQSSKTIASSPAHALTAVKTSVGVEAWPVQPFSEYESAETELQSVEVAAASTAAPGKVETLCLELKPGLEVMVTASSPVRVESTNNQGLPTLGAHPSGIVCESSEIAGQQDDLKASPQSSSCSMAMLSDDKASASVSGEDHAETSQSMSERDYIKPLTSVSGGVGDHIETSTSTVLLTFSKPAIELPEAKKTSPTAAKPVNLPDEDGCGTKTTVSSKESVAAAEEPLQISKSDKLNFPLDEIAESVEDPPATPKKLAGAIEPVVHQAPTKEDLLNEQPLLEKNMMESPEEEGIVPAGGNEQKAMATELEVISSEEQRHGQCSLSSGTMTISNTPHFINDSAVPTLEDPQLATSGPISSEDKATTLLGNLPKREVGSTVVGQVGEGKSNSVILAENDKLRKKDNDRVELHEKTTAVPVQHRTGVCSPEDDQNTSSSLLAKPELKTGEHAEVHRSDTLKTMEASQRTKESFAKAGEKETEAKEAGKEARKEAQDQSPKEKTSPLASTQPSPLDESASRHTRLEQESASRHARLEQERKEMEERERAQAIFRQKSFKQQQEKEQARLRKWRQDDEEKRRKEKEQKEEELKAAMRNAIAEVTALEELKESRAKEQAIRLAQIEEERCRQEAEEAAKISAVRAMATISRKVSKPEVSEDSSRNTQVAVGVGMVPRETVHPPRESVSAGGGLSNHDRIEEERKAIEAMERQLADRRAQRAREHEAALVRRENQRKEEEERQKRLDAEREEHQRLAAAEQLQEEMEMLEKKRKDAQAREEERAKERQAQVDAERNFLMQHEEQISSMRQKLICDQEMLRREKDESMQRHLHAKEKQHAWQERRLGSEEKIASISTHRLHAEQAELDKQVKQIELERQQMLDEENRLVERRQELRKKHELEQEEKQKREKEKQELEKIEKAAQMKAERKELEEMQKAERKAVSKESHRKLSEQSKALQEADELIEKERQKGLALDQRIAELRSRSSLAENDNKEALASEDDRWKEEISRFEERKRELEADQLAIVSLEERLAVFREQLCDSPQQKRSTPPLDLDQLARQEWEAKNSPRLLLQRKASQVGDSEQTSSLLTKKADKDIRTLQDRQRLSSPVSLGSSTSGSRLVSPASDDAVAQDEAVPKLNKGSISKQDVNRSGRSPPSSKSSSSSRLTSEEITGEDDEVKSRLQAARRLWEAKSSSSLTSSPRESPLLRQVRSFSSSPQVDHEPNESLTSATHQLTPNKHIPSSEQSALLRERKSGSASTPPPPEIISSEICANDDDVVRPTVDKEEVIMKLAPALKHNASLGQPQQRARAYSLPGPTLRPAVDVVSPQKRARPSTPVLSRITHLASDSEGESSGGEDDPNVKRQRSAAKWVEKELRKLVSTMREIGEVGESGICELTFGRLFEETANIFEALSGTLLTARKHKIVSYEGTLLLQGVHDNVNIVLLTNDVPDAALGQFIKQRRTTLTPETERRGRAFSTGSLHGQNKCHMCGMMVYAAEYLSADDRAFHKTCFRCLHCQKQLNTTNYASIDGRYYCKVHYERLYRQTGNYSGL